MTVRRPPAAPAGGAGRHGSVRSPADRRAALGRRRARVALLAATAFAAVVLGTSLPVHTLLAQRAEQAATAADVRHLEAENASLAAQAKALANPATVRALAHSELDYVLPGQRTFDVVASGSSGVPGVGHELLDQPPVLPGSAASEQAIGLVGVGGSPTASRPATARPTAADGGILQRMLHVLEFWR